MSSKFVSCPPRASDWTLMARILDRNETEGQSGLTPSVRASEKIQVRLVMTQTIKTSFFFLLHKYSSHSDSCRDHFGGHSSVTANAKGRGGEKIGCK